MSLLRAILQQVDHSTARRLRIGVVASCLLAPIEVLGVALVVPLLELLSEDGIAEGGAAGTISGWTGIERAEDLALFLGGLIVLLFAIRAAATLALRWWMLGTLFRAERDTAVKLLRGYMQEPYAKHLGRNSAEILRTLQGSVGETFGSYVAATLNVFAEVLVGASIVVLLLVVQPLPTLVLGVYFAVVGPLYIRIVQRRAYGVGARIQDLNREGILIARDSLDGVKELSVLQRQDESVRRYSTVRHQTASARRAMQFLKEAPRFTIEILFLLGVMVLLAALALSGSAEAIVTALGVFVAAGFRLMPPLGRLISAQAAMRSSAAAVEITIGELERLDSESKRLATAAQASIAFERCVRFERVSFLHDGAEVPSLEDVDLEIVPGESVAIVGPSGAGKTTFVDLILGLHAPTTGVISVDGFSLEDCLPSWRSLIGYVPQDVFLADASLRENIALGVPVEKIDDGAVERAVREAQLSDLVSQLDLGVASAVGERGLRLSGGQRQRIGIARALYNAPKVLILDEATSALDSETEARIADTIRDLRSRMTVLAIAHRLSTLRDFERVIFLDSGRLVGDGSFEDLQRALPDFARLLEQANFDVSAGR